MLQSMGSQSRTRLSDGTELNLTSTAEGKLSSQALQGLPPPLKFILEPQFLAVNALTWPWGSQADCDCCSSHTVDGTAIAVLLPSSQVVKLTRHPFLNYTLSQATNHTPGFHQTSQPVQYQHPCFRTLVNICGLFLFLLSKVQQVLLIIFVGSDFFFKLPIQSSRFMSEYFGHLSWVSFDLFLGLAALSQT